MPLFSKCVDGPNVIQIKVTLENLCSELNSNLYDLGVDRDTLVKTLSDIYEWIVVNKDTRISVPAPRDDLDDRHRYIFPEGARVSTRRSSRASSVTSTASSSLPKQALKLSSHYTRSHASTSSANRYQPTHIGFAEEEEDFTDVPVNRTRTMPRRSEKRNSNRAHASMGDVMNRGFDVGASTENLFPPERKPRPRQEAREQEDVPYNQVPAGFAVPVPQRKRANTRPGAHVGFAGDD